MVAFLLAKMNAKKLIQKNKGIRYVGMYINVREFNGSMQQHSDIFI